MHNPYISNFSSWKRFGGKYLLFNAEEDFKLEALEELIKEGCSFLFDKHPIYKIWSIISFGLRVNKHLHISLGWVSQKHI